MAKSTKALTKKVTKFSKDSVEGTSIRHIKGRQKKIDTAGMTLVGLWYEQGKELVELQAILECSQRQLEVHTGVKRSAINTYINIAQDPRLGEEGINKQLANFTQKDLIKLGKLDEDEFNEAVETGKMPKASSDEAHTDTKAPANSQKSEAWKDELYDLIDDAKDFYSAKEALLVHFASIEKEDTEDTEVVETADVETADVETADVETADVELLNQAITKTGHEDVAEQALAIGVKKGVLKTAINDGIMSKATVKKITAFLEVA